MSSFSDSDDTSSSSDSESLPKDAPSLKSLMRNKKSSSSESSSSTDEDTCSKGSPENSEEEEVGSSHQSRRPRMIQANFKQMGQILRRSAARSRCRSPLLKNYGEDEELSNNNEPVVAEVENTGVPEHSDHDKIIRESRSVNDNNTSVKSNDFTWVGPIKEELSW